MLISQAIDVQQLDPYILESKNSSCNYWYLYAFLLHVRFKLIKTV